MLADLDRAARASSASKEKDALSKDADEDEQPHHGSLITQTQDAPPEELAEGPVHPHPPLHTDKDTLGIVNSHEHAKGVTWQELTQQKYTLLSALFASIAGLLFGIDQGILSVILTTWQFKRQFPLIDDDRTRGAAWLRGVLSAVLVAGCALGAMAAGYVADRLGRKNSLRFGAVFFLVGAILQTTSFAYAQMVVGRFVGGIGVGFLSMTAPLFMSEIAPPRIRGFVLAMQELAIVSGVVVAFYTSFGTHFIQNDWSWRSVFLLQMLPAFILLGLSLFLPESPRWQGRDPARKAHVIQVIARLRSKPPTDPEVQAEYIDIRAQHELQQIRLRERHPQLFDHGDQPSGLKLELVAWADCFRGGCLRRTIVGAGVMFFQQLIGVNALVYYAPSLFAQLGLDYSTQLQCSGAVNVGQVVGSAVMLYAMDRFGRKPLLLLGSFILTITLLIVTLLTGLYQDSWSTHSAAGWGATGLLLFFMVEFGCSWGTLGWAIPSELFPITLRSKGVAISTMTCWIFNLIVVMITPALTSQTGYGVFLFYCVFAFLSIFFVIFLVPETNGVPLEKMDEVFGDHTGAQDQILLQEIYSRLLPANVGEGEGRDEEEANGRTIQKSLPVPDDVDKEASNNSKSASQPSLSPPFFP